MKVLTLIWMFWCAGSGGYTPGNIAGWLYYRAAAARRR